MSEQTLNSAIEQAAAARQRKLNDNRKGTFVKLTEMVVDKINKHPIEVNSDSDSDDEIDTIFDDFFKIDSSLKSEINDEFKYLEQFKMLNDLWRIGDSLDTFPN